MKAKGQSKINGYIRLLENIISVDIIPDGKGNLLVNKNSDGLLTMAQAIEVSKIFGLVPLVRITK